MKNKELILSSGDSHVRNLEIFELSDLESFKSVIKANFVQEGICVFYLDYVVLIGKYDGKDFHFYQNEKLEPHLLEPHFIQKMRLFDEDQELYLWRKNKNQFRGRLRIDGIGEKTDVVDVEQVLWGTRSKSLGNYIELCEDRGTKIILPFKNIKIDAQKDPKDRIRILTRNYVSYDTNSSYEQAGYVDCRFVAFKNSRGDLLWGDENGE